MKPFWKPLALALLVLLGSQLASAATPSGSLRFKALASAWICDCCPKTCLGGTLSGCFNTTSMPPNAVTCTYHTPGQTGDDPSCVSCMAYATPASEKDTFLQSLANP